jgi:predicted ester cyclase
MSEANKQLVRRWFEEVWNQKSEAAIDEMFDSRGKSHGFPDSDSVLEGPEAFKVLHRTFCGAFPDMRLSLEDVVAEGDRVAIRWSAAMTHLGDHLGFPATSKKAKLGGSSFLIVRDGRIAEGWNQMDLQRLFQELKDVSA